jgi:D-glycero-D-manno-heptose 1,7-bisphosphate phosphatase
MNKAIFFDRDGVLIEAPTRNGKPKSIENISDIKFIADVELILKLKQLGYYLIVVTNQPDISRKLISHTFVESVNSQIKKKYSLNRFYVCPHSDSDDCLCRKPKNGLILEAKKDYNLDLNKCFMIGDRWKDIIAAEISGCKSIFIDYNYNEKKPSNAGSTVKSIKSALKMILEIYE